MATHQVTPPEHNWPDRRRTSSNANAQGSLSNVGNYVSNNALDTRLAAISATTFTQERLDKMTQNDKLYAVRHYDDNASI